MVVAELPPRNPMAAAAATGPARPATTQLAVRPAEKARLQAKFWPPSESKAAVKAAVKARKDALADLVRPRLRKLSEAPSRDPAIRKMGQLAVGAICGHMGVAMGAHGLNSRWYILI